MSKTTITLDSRARISGLTSDQANKIMTDLTIANPAFSKAQNIGVSPFGIPKTFKYYKYTKSELIAPIGYVAQIHQHLDSTAVKVIDNRKTNKDAAYFKKFKMNKTVKLRDYQKEIVDICLDKTIGVVEAMTGSGKTFSFIDLIFKRKEHTLILVHTIELANQTIEALTKHTTLKKDDIGFIGAGKLSIKPITVALLQSLASDIRTKNGQKVKELNKTIGQIISDETHIVAAQSYYEVMTSLTAKYKFGFSATPRREDGLTKVIFLAAGPKIHTVEEKKLENVLITPTLEEVKTDYYFPLFSTTEYQEMLNDLSQDVDRNKLILEYAKKHKDKFTCILSSRLSQVEYLNKNIKGSEKLTSKMSKKKRAEVMKRLKEGKIKVIISTYGLFSTGIDFPSLEMLFLAGPIKSEIKIRQSAGRLMRKAMGKTSATIIDFHDHRVDLLHSQFLKRKRIIKKIMKND
jgi:superfamily II DNA or RNA helicase